MAVLRCATSSNWPAVDPDRVDELNALISKYDFSGDHESLTVNAKHVDEDRSDADAILEVYGGASFHPQRIEQTYIDRPADLAEDSTEEFLDRVAEFLESPLIIQTIGREKYRFPFVAVQYTVWPNGTVDTKSFDTSAEKPVAADGRGGFVHPDKPSEK